MNLTITLPPAAADAITNAITSAPSEPLVTAAVDALRAAFVIYLENTRALTEFSSMLSFATAQDGIESA